MLVLAALLAATSFGIAAILRESLIDEPPRALVGKNFRSAEVPIIGGMVLAAGLLIVEAVFAIFATLRPLELARGTAATSPGAIPATFASDTHLGLIVLTLGFFALGLFDDAAGSRGDGEPGRDEMISARGFRGHFGALAGGNVTTGVLKALAGGALAFVVASFWELEFVSALIDASVIAFAANTLNLLDVRPGRAVKFFFVVWIPLAAVLWSSPYFPVTAIIASAAGVWLPADLKEKGMLGDGGSNMLGAILGAGMVLTLSLPWRAAVGALLLLLNLASERWSFSNVIARTPPLNFFDLLGRRREEPAHQEGKKI